MAPGLPHMRLSEFLSQLPEVQEVTDHDECPVCLQSYLPTTAPITPAPGMIQGFLSRFLRQRPEPIEPESALQLPCQHVIGSKCIKRWLSSVEGHNTCPYCIKQLFTPIEHPYCNHPGWDMLMDRLGDYGFLLERSWNWIWRPSKTFARITKKDILNWSILAKPAATTLVERLLANKNAVDKLRDEQEIAKMLAGFDPERTWKADQKTVDNILGYTSLRSTLYLRETVWYLYYQQQRTNLPALGRLSCEYPFRTLQKHHEDALFGEMDRDGVFDNQQVGSLSHRELWNVWRDMGMTQMDRIHIVEYGH